MGGGTMLTSLAGAVGKSPDLITILSPTTTTAAASTTTTSLHSHHPPSSSSSSSTHLESVSANCGASFRQSSTKRTGLGEACTKIEDKRASGSSYDHVFGPVPSRIEVEKAIADLQKFMRGLPTSGSETDWLQQMLYLYDPRMPQTLGYGTLYNAFHLLQTEPSVQGMVISISSDKVVWEAILNNKAVQDLGESLYSAKKEKRQSSNEESDIATVILKWILGITKAKVMELVGKFGFLVNELLQPAEKEKPTSELTDLLEEKIRSSFLLSMMILLIVVVTRSHGA